VNTSIVLMRLSQPLVRIRFGDRTQNNILAEDCRLLGLNPRSPEANVASIFCLILSTVWLLLNYGSGGRLVI
jgi:hypothetical protein